MPYFPKEETETIDLFDIEYERNDSGDLVTEKGQPKVLSRRPTGQNLEVIRKDVPVNVSRIYMAELEAAQNLDKRIKALTEQLLKNEQTDQEYDALQGRITELKTKPDSLSAMCGYIASSLKQWDYFASKADFEAGNPVPLEPAEIRAKCDPKILGQIVDFLNGRYEEDARLGKGSPVASQSGSSQKELSESAQASTLTS
jgi:hypothetical protein